MAGAGTQALLLGLLSLAQAATAISLLYEHKLAPDFLSVWLWLALALAALLFVALPLAANLLVTWRLPRLVRAAAPHKSFAQA